MFALFIDSCTDYFHVAVLKDGAILFAERIKADKNMTEFAVKRVGAAISAAKIRPKDLARIYVTTGPGSFTSVRIGLTIAKTIVSVHQEIRLYHATSLLFQLGPGDGISLINARSGMHYLAWRANGELREETAPVLTGHVEQLVAANPRLPVFKDLSDDQILVRLQERLDVFQPADDYKQVKATYFKPAFKE